MGPASSHAPFKAEIGGKKKKKKKRDSKFKKNYMHDCWLEDGGATWKSEKEINSAIPITTELEKDLEP